MTNHCTPFINISFLENKKPEPLPEHIIQNIDFNRLNSLLSTERWEKVLLETDPQEVITYVLINFITT